MRGKTKELLREGVKELMEHLSSQSSHKLALATSATQEEIDTVLGHNGLKLVDKFRFIVSGDKVSKPKPHPQTY